MPDVWCLRDRSRHWTAPTQVRPAFTGSLIVAEFPSLEEASAWADADPYVTAGVFSEVLVRPFKRVLP
jgi:uncharacterized protein YciI